METQNFVTRHFVNKRQIWMHRKKQLSLSNTLSDLHLQEATPSEQDRISTLPEEILHRILSLLPMEMAIRTSILSKAWRHLWKYTRVVDFHNLPFANGYEFDYTPITRSLDLIESLDIESFTVVGHVGDRSYPEVRKWVDFALSKNVHTLRIGLMSIPSPMRFFLLPKSLFTKNDQTQKLKVLFLSCVDYAPYHGVIFSASGFASLQTLVFTNCKLADRIVELFLLECLVLEVLVLDMCKGLANVNISGSNLKLKQLTFKWNEYECDYGELRLLQVDAPGLLTLIYSGGLTKILLKNCQGLVKIILLGKNEQINEANIDHFRELINQITQVKTLGVNFQFLQFVAREYYTRDISPYLEFENVEHLFWCDSLGSPNDVYHLVAFLGDCPSLQDCVIDFREKRWAAFCDTVWENYVEHEFLDLEGAQNKLYQYGRYLKKLKSIRVLCFSGFNGEMMLVRLLLEKAVNLQKMELFWRNDISTMTDNVLQVVFKIDEAPDLVAKIQEDSNSIKEKITSFPKASPNAQVLYKRKWELCQWYNVFGA